MTIWKYLLEVERTSKNRTSNIPNLRGSNFEHIRTSHLGPKPNFEPLEHHQKPNCSRTLLIKNGPNFFQNHQNRTSNMSEHVILAKNRTSNLPNITKNRTVREHRTVRSTSNNNNNNCERVHDLSKAWVIIYILRP